MFWTPPTRESASVVRRAFPIHDGLPSQNVELGGSKTERLRGHSLSCEIQRAAAARAAPRFDARRCRDAVHAMTMTCHAMHRKPRPGETGTEIIKYTTNNRYIILRARRGNLLQYK